MVAEKTGREPTSNLFLCHRNRSTAFPYSNRASVQRSYRGSMHGRGRGRPEAQGGRLLHAGSTKADDATRMAPTGSLESRLHRYPSVLRHSAAARGPLTVLYPHWPAGLLSPVSRVAVAGLVRRRSLHTLKPLRPPSCPKQSSRAPPPVKAGPLMMQSHSCTGYLRAIDGKCARRLALLALVWPEKVGVAMPGHALPWLALDPGAWTLLNARRERLLIHPF